MKIVIVGGVAGGATAAARLRRLDEDGEIVLLERGRHISYANCGLPYYVGGVVLKKESLTPQTPEGFGARYRVDVRVRSEAVRVDPVKKTVTVRDLEKDRIYEEPYDRLILSPGAEPRVPPFLDAERERIFTLRTVPDALALDSFIKERKPKNAVVLGAGPVGLEMAENLKRRGLEVLVIELGDQALAYLDEEMAAAVHLRLRSQGIGLLLRTKVDAVESVRDGLIVKSSRGKIKTRLLFVSAGVQPESSLARSAGLRLGERGHIVTDSALTTSDPRIHALGDAAEIRHSVSGRPTWVALAGPANKQARAAADNIRGIKTLYRGSQGSSVVKVFDLAVCATGLSEKSARALGMKHGALHIPAPSHVGYYPGAESLLIKVVFAPDTGRILGAQVVGGDGADKRADVLAAAAAFRATAFDLTQLELCYAPPYGSPKDPVNLAGCAVENVVTGKVKQFHWREVAGLDPRKSNLLDVRTEKEFRAGAAPGFQNIPLDVLRENIGRLDPEKPVHVMCQVGMRGYVASRLLSQKGFDVRNLSGGYAVWDQAVRGSSPDGR
ncbi:MAG: FAD-dependent oxidoreductase [Deltaproteobacteria bacterium]|jgi:NADPH-dependent 2,4-dienoyl-CoA reductase/sulfur reductase-like enzyme/rhodanese-related sulfurtransferase|nr:FAD-dependent oxidoreductase [Deltaproteobacteria bacterium]